ncbi:MAG TPA: site-specific integrase, partial [Rheinheimera sp.]|nr:site-specific integrase [Rheinheimera sp.]
MTEQKPTDADAALISEFLDQLWLDKGVSPHTLAAYGTDL